VNFSMAIIGKSKSKNWGITGNIGLKRLSEIWHGIVKMISN
jgi:hypothetical protein